MRHQYSNSRSFKTFQYQQIPWLRFQINKILAHRAPALTHTPQKAIDCYWHIHVFLGVPRENSCGTPELQHLDHKHLIFWDAESLLTCQRNVKQILYLQLFSRANFGPGT